MDTPKIKKSEKIKEIERLPSDEKNNIIFKSYMHHFGNYKRIIIALHHLQEVEKMHNKDPSLKFYFKFQRKEDSDVFEEVARVFNADVLMADFEDLENENEITCLCVFDNDNAKYSKIKTCVFTYDTEFYKEWLSNTIPKIISRQRSEGMQYIRFIALRSDTSDKLVKELKYQGLECTVKAFHVTYDKTTNRAIFVHSIICKLS